MIVGVLESARYETARCRLAPGEAILLYTDGLTEAADRNDEFFGEQRLEALLKEKSSSKVEQWVTSTHQAVRNFSAGVPQADDITVMALRYLG